MKDRTALSNLAAGYREAAVLLRLALEDLEAMERTPEVRHKLCVTRQALAEMRDLRELCERYYEPDYYADTKYSAQHIRAPKLPWEDLNRRA